MGNVLAMINIGLLIYAEFPALKVYNKVSNSGGRVREQPDLPWYDQAEKRLTSFDVSY